MLAFSPGTPSVKLNTTPSTVPSPALWTADPSCSRPTMTPVTTSPIAMENFPLFVAHTTGPLTFWGCPPTVTCAGPPAAGVLPVAAGELVAALDDVALDDVALDDEVPDALLPLEQAATPATTVAAQTAIHISRFTESSFG